MTALPTQADAPTVTGERRPTPRRRRGRIGYVREIVVTLVLIPVCALWIYPFLWMVSASLKSDTEIFGNPALIPEEIHLENYARAWYEANIGQYFWNTIFITAACITVVTVTTAMMGYVLGRKAFPGKRIVIVAFLATLFLPEGYTIIPVFELVSRLGLAGSLWGVILAESGGAHVIIIFLFAGYFRQLPNELDEAARIEDRKSVV